MNKILVIFLNSLGDVVRVTPIFSILRKKYPSAYIAALSEPLGAELLRGDNDIDEVFEFKSAYIKEIFNSGNSATMDTFCNEILRLTDVLRDIQFDLVLNYQFSEISALIAYTIKPCAIAGRTLEDQGDMVIYGKNMGRLYSIARNIDNKRLSNRKNLVDLIIATTADIGIEGLSADPHVAISQDDEYFAEMFLDKHNVKQEQLLIGVQPGVGHFYEKKAWPADRFATLLNTLHEKYRAQILINGIKGEREDVIARIVSDLDFEPVISAGETTIKQAAALIKKCSLFVSNVSAPMHIAAAVGVPTIGLFGRDFPFEARPYGANHCVVVDEAMSAISVIDVLNACEIILSVCGIIKKTISENQWQTITDMNKENGIYLFQ